MGKRLLPVILFLALLSGCSDPRNTVSLGGGGSAAGQLYVSTNSAILRFNSALTVTGNAAPAATIAGAATTLSNPQHLLIDPTTNRLFVANQGGSSVLVYENASAVTGNAVPTRSISGPATLLSAPHDLALDATNNALYVADGTQILVFSSAGTINGNVPPVHNISMGFTVGAIVLDVANNRLYATNSTGNFVDRLEGASLQDGGAVVAASITGSSTGLAGPQGLALDTSGRLIVSNASGPSITIYANAATASGNSTPVATIAGAATQLVGPNQIVLNPLATGGDLYIADTVGGKVLIFSNLAGANGNLAPARTISGTGTGLLANATNGIALDTTR